jgi:hypothetical protein
MFAVRGIAVSFSIFVLLYGALSVLICGVWRRLWPGAQRYSAGRCADLLFVVRLVPFVAAAGVTLALAVPSFLLLEPRAVDEPMSAVPVALGLGGMAVVVAGMWKAAAALVRVSRMGDRLQRHQFQGFSFRAADFGVGAAAHRRRHSATQRMVVGGGGVCVNRARVGNRAAA